MKIEFVCQNVDTLENATIAVDAPTLDDAHSQILSTFPKTKIISGKQLEGDVRELDGSIINTNRSAFSRPAN